MIKNLLVVLLSILSCTLYAQNNAQLVQDTDSDLEVVCPLQALKKRPSDSQINALVERHNEWIKLYKLDNPITWDNLTQTQIKQILADPRRADFSRTDLSGLQLDNLILRGANFNGAKLDKADLRQLDLSFSDLSCASFSGASIEKSLFNHALMIKTRLIKTTVSRSDFRMANLTRADLEEANLSGNAFHRAKLISANLVRGNFEHSNLTDTDMTLAKVDFADFSNSVWEPDSGTIPSAHTAARIKNLSALSYNDSPAALIELRESFAAAGMDEAQRQVTYAINKTKNKKLAENGIQGVLTAGFNFVLFDLTSEYGRSPTRPLKIILLMILLFSFPYYLAIKKGGYHTVWRVWNPDRIQQKIGGEPQKIEERGIKAVLFALYFSITSAFRLGWRDINVGDWLSNIQHHEYNLQGTGWIRSLSGVQSVVSMYLLALWILTFFTTPFG